jgi:mono/diheme cytochrome c family protein
MLYSAYCAVCHGPSGRGDGQIASALKTRPPDLTLIAARRKGTFPSDEVARIIDGGKPMKAHGDGDMPAWGEALAKSYDTLPVEERIRRLVAYLESIQVRAK